MNSFDFNIGNKHLPAVGLVSGGLNFNPPCAELLGYPEYISIGIDRENKKIAVKATKADDNTKNCHRFSAEENKDKRVYVQASKIYTEILKLMSGEPVRRGTKFLAVFDGNAGMLVVDLKTKIDV